MRWLRSETRPCAAYLAHALVHPLPRREEEGDAAPPLRIDREHERGEGGAARARRHRRVLEVAGLVAVACEGLHLREQRHLRRLDRRARHRRRRVHREPHERLQQVVLDDVSDDPEAVEVAAAAAGAQILFERELHTLDVLRVPRRLEDLVRPAERRDVEDHLLAQVVVEAEELALVEDRRREAVQRVEGLRVAAERLLDHQPRVPGRRRSRVRRDHLGHCAEDRRRHREEVEAVGAGFPALELLERGVEGDVRARLVVCAGVEVDAIREDLLRQPGVLLDVDALLRDEGGEVDGLPPVADDREVGREVAEEHELVECREQLLLGEIARRAEDDD